MSRNEKIFIRLEQLSLDFRDLLIKELEKIIGGKSSNYFYRKNKLFNYGIKAVGKFWQDKETASIEMIEKEILSLSEKLNDPASRVICDLSDEFVAEREDLKDRFDGGEKSLARKYIEILNEIN